MPRPKDNSVILACDDQGSPVAISAPVQREDGKWAQSFRKTVVRRGEFTKDSAGLQFSIDDSTFGHWQDQFAAMSEDGIEVPITMGHTNDDSAKRGTVKSMFPENDNFVAIVELEADTPEEIESMRKMDVSIYAPDHYLGPKGQRFKFPIRHVALTDTPAITGLGEFQQLAASSGKRKRKIPVLTPQVETDQMDLSEIKKALSLDEDVTEDNVVSLVCDSVKSLTKQVEAAEAKAAEAEKKAKDSDPEPELKLSNNERAAAKRVRDLRLDELVKEGKLTPAARDKILPHLSSDLMLSADDKGDCFGFEAIIDALKLNEPSVKFGDGSKHQSLSLTHNDSAEGFDKDTHNTMRKFAGIKEAS